MRRLAVPVAVLLAFLVAAPVALVAAQGATPHATPAAVDLDELVVPPDETAYGATYPEWVARSAQWFLSFSTEASPFLDETGARCTYGQHGPVFFLEGGLQPETVRACAVPAGAALLVPIIGVGCSTVEPPPFFGRDEAELQACAEGLLQTPDEISLSVNGAEVPDLERFRMASAPFSISLPPDNLPGVEPAVGLGVLAGYFVLLAPLPPGEYEVRYALDLPEADPGATTYRLTVSEPQVVEPPAGSPAAEAATPAA